MIELFSRTFATDVWGRHSVELAMPEMPIRDEDVFDALSQYALCPEHIKARNPNAEALTVLNGTLTSEPDYRFLIAEDDKDLNDYLRRIDELANDNEWSVMYYGLHAASPKIWDTAKLFSDRLALSIGYRPGGRVDVDCFIGRYSSTHVGIHVDRAHNFGFTLRDGKTMYTWPGSRSDLIGKRWPEYEIDKPEGTPLTNRRDRVAYFPEDAPHVAESRDNVSMNLNLAFWNIGNDVKSSIPSLNSIIDRANRRRHDIRSSGLSSILPDTALFLSSLERQINASSLSRQMMVSQLIFDTSSRLNQGRPTVDVDEVGDLITINSESTLQWIPLLESGEILIAANGHCAAFIDSATIQNFLELLVNGTRLDISDLNIDDPADSELLSVIASLARWGAIQ